MKLLVRTEITAVLVDCNVCSLNSYSIVFEFVLEDTNLSPQNRSLNVVCLSMTSFYDFPSCLTVSYEYSRPCHGSNESSIWACCLPDKSDSSFLANMNPQKNIKTGAVGWRKNG